MTSRWIMAGTGIGLGALVVAAAYAVRQVIGEPSAPVDFTLLVVGDGLVIAWLAQPLLGLGRSAPLPRPNQIPAPDEPRNAVPYDMTEPEWIRGKLLYRGVHNAAGAAWRIARTLPWVLLLYFLLAALTYRSPRGEFLRDPANTVLTVVALAAAYVLVDNLYRAPFEAARTFRANGHLWWPATIGWNADAIFIRNGEGYFRYALADCRAWKEDDALILLYTADDRYWCLPKHALADAGRLEKFEQLLQQRLAKISPYKVVYRWR